MFPQRVTFLTVPASSISHTAHGSGQLLRYDMIIGIQVGKDSVRFQHPDHDLYVTAGARPGAQRINMPQLMAARLIPFARACLVTRENPYDNSMFVVYVSGLQPSPWQRSKAVPTLSSEYVDSVSDMAHHVIGDAEGRVLHAFIGLPGQQALSIHGKNGAISIAAVADLMRVYGGTMLGRVNLQEMS